MFAVLICLLAGLGAGAGTGFAGMSAAAVIAPMLITFLQVDSYLAVGIALASDVLASAASAVTYYRHKHMDVKNGLVMMLCVLLFTVVGSWVASLVPLTLMGNFSTVMTMLLGLKFLVKPVTSARQAGTQAGKTKRIVQSVLCGAIVGFICGFVGAGGGMMMLLLLTAVLGYELKTAVGTSVLIMSFTACTGSISHFVIGGLPNVWYLVLCVGFTFVFALIASRIANRLNPVLLNRIVGVILLVLGGSVLLVNWFS